VVGHVLFHAGQGYPDADALHVRSASFGGTSSFATVTKGIVAVGATPLPTVREAPVVSSAHPRDSGRVSK